VFVAKAGHFLEKEFLAKVVSGRTVQVDEISESLATIDRAKEPEVILQIIPTTELGVVASDAETSDKFVIEPCRSGRAIEPPEWFIMKSSSLKMMNLCTTRKQWWGLAQENGTKP
jgi:hypothetical protein